MKRRCNHVKLSNFKRALVFKECERPITVLNKSEIRIRSNKMHWLSLRDRDTDVVLMLNIEEANPLLETCSLGMLSLFPPLWKPELGRIMSLVLSKIRVVYIIFSSTFTLVCVD